MSLAEIQLAFKAAIYDENPDALSSLVSGPRNRPALEGVSVYRNNTHERLKSVLKQIYPVSLQLVGESCFSQLARLHISLRPCHSHDLDRYGEDFAGTIERLLEQEAALKMAVPYLAEMASTERHLHSAYYAANRTAFDYQDFSRQPKDRLGELFFQLQPDLALLKAHWPVAQIWEMHQPGREIREISLTKIREYYLIERPKYLPIITPIDRTMYGLLRAIENGASLEELVTDLEDAQTLLTRAFQNNCIGGFRLGKSN